MYLPGWLRKLGVSLEAAEQLINELAKDDEEKDNRIRTLHETYKKQDLDEITGYSGLLKLLSYDCTEDDAKEKLRQGKTISKEYEKIQRNRKKQELLPQIETESSKEREKETDSCKLILGDFREKGKEIEDNSIGLILTDPPYSREYLTLYQALAELAVRLFKPRGSLVFFVGHIIIDEVAIFSHI